MEERRHCDFGSHRPCRNAVVADVRPSRKARRYNSLPPGISNDVEEGLPVRSRLARAGRKIDDPCVSADLHHFLPRSRDLLPLHRVTRHSVASGEVRQRRTAGSLSSPIRVEGRFRVAGRHVDDGDQRRLGFGSRCRDDGPARRRLLAAHRREIFCEQCRRRVSRCSGAPGRSGGGCARAGPVPGAAIPQRWRAQLFCAAAKGQDWDPLCSDRRSGAERQRRLPARPGGLGNLSDP